jgi:hypothetical protein
LVAWYVKALQAMQGEGAPSHEATILNNLADMLVSPPGRLNDARVYAEQALAIKKTLDPAGTEIWKTYQVLANIAAREGDTQAVRSYSSESRMIYAAAPIGQETLRRHGDLIKSAVAAVADPSKRPPLEDAMARRVEHNWTKLVEALRRILDGERDEVVLYAYLDREDSVIVQAVLHGIADPESLKAIPSAEPGIDKRASHQLERHLPLISRVVAAGNQPELRSQLDPVLEEMQRHGWGSLVASLRRIVDGERSANALLDGLDEEDTLIISAVLIGLESPEAPRDLPGPSPSAQPDP